LKTLLLLVLSDATTDSPWPLSNNPRAKYNDPARRNSNAKFPLWQVVRASTAAPTFFPRRKSGSVATPSVRDGRDLLQQPVVPALPAGDARAYGVMWPSARRNMLLVSIGTGLNPNVQQGLRSADMHAAAAISTATEALFNAAMYQQDQLCASSPLLVRRDAGRRSAISSHERPADPSRLFTYGPTTPRSARRA